MCAKGLSVMAVSGGDHHGTQWPCRWETESSARAGSKPDMDRGVCESALKLHHTGKAVWGKCHGRQPDSGKPTVRDDTGGLRKRGSVVERGQSTRSSRVRRGVIESQPFRSLAKGCARRISIPTPSTATNVKRGRGMAASRVMGTGEPQWPSDEAANPR